MKTYRLEVYGFLNGIHCHLFGRENLSYKQAQRLIMGLTTETYSLIEEAA